MLLCLKKKKKKVPKKHIAETYILQTLDIGKASGYQSVETRLNCNIHQNKVLKYKYRLSIWTMTAQAITISVIFPNSHKTLKLSTGSNKSYTSHALP